MRRRLGGLLLLVVAAGLWPAVSRGQTATQSLSIAVGGKSLIAYLPLTLAERLDYFSAEGLKVDVQDFPGGSKSLESLVGGSVDMVAGAYENTLFMQVKGFDIVTVFLNLNRFGLVLGLSKNAAASYHSPKDLKGLKIGVSAPGSATENVLRIILAKGGLTLNDVSTIGIGGGAGAVASMEAGQIDGMVNSDPVIMKLTLDGALVPVVDSRLKEGQDYIYGGPSAATGAYTTLQFIKEHRATVQAFVNAMVRTIKWFNAASVDQIMAVVPPEYYGHDKELYRRSLEANKVIFTKDGRITLAEATNTLNAVQASGRLPADAAIDLSRTFDTSFVALAEPKE